MAAASAMSSKRPGKSDFQRSTNRRHQAEFLAAKLSPAGLDCRTHVSAE
ncbi:hypothetical protein [Sodalis sp.]